jgi:hypothetical protein
VISVVALAQEAATRARPTRTKESRFIADTVLPKPLYEDKSAERHRCVEN